MTDPPTQMTTDDLSPLPAANGTALRPEEKDSNGENGLYVVLVSIILVIIVLCVILCSLRRLCRCPLPVGHLNKPTGTLKPAYLDDLDQSTPKVQETPSDLSPHPEDNCIPLPPLLPEEKDQNEINDGSTPEVPNDDPSPPPEDDDTPAQKDPNKNNDQSTPKVQETPSDLSPHPEDNGIPLPPLLPEEKDQNEINDGSTPEDQVPNDDLPPQPEEKHPDGSTPEVPNDDPSPPPEDDDTPPQKDPDTNNGEYIHSWGPGIVEMIDTFDRRGKAFTSNKYSSAGSFTSACENETGKRIPKALAYAGAGVGRARAEWSVCDAEAKGPNASAIAGASLASGVKAFANAEVASASASAGPVKATVGLAADTGISISPLHVEAKVLGTGFSVGRKFGISVLGTGFEVKLF